MTLQKNQRYLSNRKTGGYLRSLQRTRELVTAPQIRYITVKAIYEM